MDSSSNWPGTLYNHRLNDQMGLPKYMYTPQKARDLCIAALIRSCV